MKNINVHFHHKDNIKSESFLKKLAFVQDNLTSRFVISLVHVPDGERDWVWADKFIGNNTSQGCTAFVTDDLEESVIQFKYFVSVMENLYNSDLCEG